MRRSLRRSAAIAFVLSMSTTGAAIAGPGALYEVDPIASDAAGISEQTGWSVDATVQLLERQAEFGRVVARLASDFPDSFAGAWIGDSALPTYTVSFKGNMTPRQVELLTHLSFDIETATDAVYSHAELEARRGAIERELLGRRYSFGSAISLRDQVIEVVVAKGSDVSAASEVRNVLPFWAVEPDVAVSVVSTQLGAGDTAYGGTWMRDDGNRECTSGFVVVSGSTRGLSTAGHCHGINQYERPNGTLVPTQFRGEMQGTYGDVEWHTTNDTEVAQFYSSPTTVRTVTARESLGSIIEGNWYCTWGRKQTSSKCDTVYRTATSCYLENTGKWIQRLVANTHKYMTGGDSGGPVFTGGKAVGSHVGWCDYFGVRDIFTPVDLFDEALGVTVLTG